MLFSMAKFMVIVIDNKGCVIEGKRLIYSLYYFSTEEFEASTMTGAFKKVLEFWAAELENREVEDERPLFLPYAPCDQDVECLEAIFDNGNIVLRDVDVAFSGYYIDMHNLEIFMNTPHKLLKESKEIIGKFEKQVLIDALRNPLLLD